MFERSMMQLLDSCVSQELGKNRKKKKEFTESLYGCGKLYRRFKGRGG